MSGSIPGGRAGGGFSGLARLIADSGEVRKRFDTLTQQVSTGLIANTYAGLESGLGGNATMSLTLHPRVTSLQNWQDNIDAAQGRAQVTQTAMKRIQAIGSDLLSSLTGLNGLNPANIDAVAANARGALAEVGNLLNSQYGNTYVFAGEDTANPPVPNPDQITSSGFYAQINAAVGGLSAAGAASTAAATLAVAGSNAAGTSPFSAFQSQPPGAIAPPPVATGQGRSESFGLLAGANANIPASSGSSTTGSYMRDLMRALATVGSLVSAQANDPNLAGLVSDTRASLSDANTAMATDAGVMGQKQSRLNAEKVTMQDTATALDGQIANAEQVDMAATLSNLTLTQTRLQASYQLISAANGMSLVKFLPG